MNLHFYYSAIPEEDKKKGQNYLLSLKGETGSGVQPTAGGNRHLAAGGTD